MSCYINLNDCSQKSLYPNLESKTSFEKKSAIFINSFKLKSFQNTYCNYAEVLLRHFWAILQ